ncbi:MAG: hypothetical protein CM1200mP41_18760 [Gammaproteobacteria bacterium]|nr:MAG: hypothetical protein CM1200mP41_18760 [Gammaproteobacteria bacterium]
MKTQLEKTLPGDGENHDRRLMEPRMDKKFVPQLRDQLREELQTLGFDFR